MTYYNGRKVREKLKAKHASKVVEAILSTPEMELYEPDVRSQAARTALVRLAMRPVNWRSRQRGYPADYVRSGLELLWGVTHVVPDRPRSAWEIKASRYGGR